MYLDRGPACEIKLPNLQRLRLGLLPTKTCQLQRTKGMFCCVLNVAHLRTPDSIFTETLTTHWAVSYLTFHIEHRMRCDFSGRWRVRL